jgi:parallel beta-helix repeat protein
MRSRHRWASLVLGLAAATARAGDLHVPADYPSIQGAIAAAAAGDVVHVAPGTYAERLDFLGKAITVTSDAGPAVTIVDGGHAGSVVRFASSEGPSSVLSGFTLRNGFDQVEGGGVFVSGASPTISGNWIVENDSCWGPGLYVSSPSARIVGNLIARNRGSSCTGGMGGGVAVGGAGRVEVSGNVIEDNVVDGGSGGGVLLWAAGTPLVANNVIRNNRASEGGGIVLYNDSDADLVQNVIVGNSAYSGGGILSSVPSGARGPLLVANTIVDNTASSGSALLLQGFAGNVVLVNDVLAAEVPGAVVCDLSYSSLTPSFRNTVAWDPSGAPYSGCPDPTGTGGNLTAVPLFGDPASGDYRTAPGSVCIDAGLDSAPLLPATDLGGAARISGAAVDVGAYEYSGPALSVAPPRVDFAPVALGSTSAVVPVTLGNPGASALGVLLEAGLAPEFLATAGSCIDPIPAGSTCAAGVAFRPATVGTARGELLFSVTGASSPLAVRLVGPTLPPTLSFAPASLDLGEAYLGYATTTVTVTVTNGNAVAVPVETIAISSPSWPPDFVETHDCPASLAAGASCAIAVTCTPSQTGPLQASLTIASPLLATPASLPLACAGVAGSIALSPASLDFGDAFVFYATTALPVTVTNPNPVALPLSFISIYDLAGPAFAETDDCPAALPPGAACTISMTCIPMAIGPRQGSLQIISSLLAAPAQVALTGFGVPEAQIAQVTPASATIDAGEIATYAVSLRRLGPFADELALSCGVDAPGTACSVAPATMRAGTAPASATVTVRTTGRSPWAPGALTLGRWPPALGLLLALAVAWPRRRRRELVPAAVAFLAVALVAGACTSSTSTFPFGNGTRSGNFQVRVQVATRTATSPYVTSAVLIVR